MPRQVGQKGGTPLSSSFVKRRSYLAAGLRRAVLTRNVSQAQERRWLTFHHIAREDEPVGQCSRLIHGVR